MNNVTILVNGEERSIQADGTSTEEIIRNAFKKLFPEETEQHNSIYEYVQLKVNYTKEDAKIVADAIKEEFDRYDRLRGI